ncbi:MAG: AAA family ATPase [Deltaproteobacteria bacterium]|nr:AAA family ATPase [Deltaproteobacteria bacterium]
MQIRKSVTICSFVHVNLDEQKAAFGCANTSNDDVPDDEWTRIFESHNDLIRTALNKGETVVQETASTTREWRARARKTAQDLGFAPYVIFVDISESVIWKRWQQNAINHSRYHTPKNVLSAYIQEFERPSADENVLRYDESIPLIK